MKKRIFFISKDSNWQLYRNEVLTKLASTYDYDVEILTTGTIKAHIKENNHVQYRLFDNLFGNRMKLSFFFGAIRYVLKERPYAVLAVNNSTQLTEYLALILCKLNGLKFVWWTHGFDHNPKLKGGLKKIKQIYTLFFLKKANAIITFSQLGKDYLVKNGLNGKIIFPALNTLDTDKLVLLKENVEKNFDKRAFLKRVFSDYSDTENSFILLFSGRLKKDKKVSNAIHALKKLNDGGILVRLLIVGDGEDRSNLEELSQSLKVEEKVHFAGHVFQEESVSEFFLASDLFIMPGYVGLAIVHAFVFGLPIITENLNYHSPEIQYLKDGINGYFVPENDVNKLACVIKQLFTDEHLLLLLKDGALKTIENEANINNMILSMNQALIK